MSSQKNAGLRWTPEEEQFLRENYLNIGVSECAKILERTNKSVNSKALKMGLLIAKKSKWSTEEEEFLKENYPTKGSVFCGNFLNRTSVSVQSKAHLMGLKCNINKKKTHKDYVAELENLNCGYTPLEEYKGASTFIAHICKNGHVTNKRPTDVLQGHKCKICDSFNKRKTHEQYLEECPFEVLEPYINNATKIKHKCSSGHVWKATPTSILQGSGCPICKPTGFDITKPAILYYIHITKDELEYYKIGITNRDVYSRFKTEPRNTKIRVIFEEKYETGDAAREAERALLQKNKQFRVNIPELLISGGNTELFEFDVLELDT